MGRRNLGIAMATLALLVAAGSIGQGAPAAADTPERGRAFAGTDPAPPVADGDARQEVVVADTTEYPARAVGTLTFSRDGVAGTCTGFLVDKNSVVTAGHCVQAGTGDTAGAWSTDLVFDPGHDGSVTPYHPCNGVAAHAPQGWRRAGDERVDYAVVQLDCGIGRRVGWFGLWLSGTGADLAGLEVRVRGYPVDVAGAQWRGGGRVTHLTSRLVFHNARTHGDSNGGPVYVATPACGGPCALAVQADEPHGQAAVHAQFPHGPRLTHHRFAQILGWAAENG